VIPIFVGLDHRESVGYHVFCHSVLARTKAEVAFYPVRGTKVVGSTQFNPGRFDVARQMGYRGWGVWAECDMLCLADIEELMALADSRCGAMVVQHSYRTKHKTKFLGQSNPDYERKNWTSLMLINAAHASWQRIPWGYRKDGAQVPYSLEDLHRLKFMDDRVGALPKEWNHLVSEYKPNPKAKIVHYTIGLPIWPEYENCEYAPEWRKERDAMLGKESV
jgi:hypothetical protein